MFRAPALTAFLWIGWLLGSGSALAQKNSDDPPPATKVFAYTTASDAQKVYLRFAILDGYYLYRARFSFASAGDGVTLGAAQFPKGQTHTDEFFGSQEVFRGKFEIAIPYKRTAAGADALALKLGLQGCADKGICYIPQTWDANIALPPASAGAVNTTDPFAAPKEKPFAASPVAATTDDLLPVDQAFVLNARFDKPNELTGLPRLPREQRLLSAGRADDVARLTGDVGVRGGRGRPDVRRGGRPGIGAGSVVRSDHWRLVLDDDRLVLCRRPVAGVHAVRAADGADPLEHHCGPG
jgi:hypothetical protein